MQGRRIWRLLMLILLLLSIGIRIPLLLNRYFDPDEFQHLHSAYCISLGMLPYQDYFEHHTPWLHYGLQWLFPIWGTSIATIYAARSSMLGLTIGVLWLNYRFGKQLYNTDVGILGTVLLAYTFPFLQSSLEIRPDVPALVCWLGALMATLKGVRTLKPIWFLLSGLALGSALMFTQKALFGIVGIGSSIGWVLIDRRFKLAAKSRRNIGLSFLCGFTVPIAVTLALFLASGGLGAFIYDNFIINAEWKIRYLPVTSTLLFVRHNPVISVLGLAGFALMLLKLLYWEEVRDGMAVPAISTVTLLIGLLVLPVAFFQYYLLFLPLWAIFAADVLWRSMQVPSPGKIAKEWGTRRGRVLTLRWSFAVFAVGCAVVAAVGYSKPSVGQSQAVYGWMWALLGAAMLLTFFLEAWQRSVGMAILVGIAYVATPLGRLGVALIVPGAILALVSPFLAGRIQMLTLFLVGILVFPFSQMGQELDKTNHGQLQEVQYVLENTSSEDSVFSAWSGGGVFRQHAYFYFFLHREMRAMLDKQELGPDIVDALRVKRPKIVSYDSDVKALPPEVIDYIESHYRPTGVGVLFRIRDG